jgi:hypothetical protein
MTAAARKPRSRKAPVPATSWVLCYNFAAGPFTAAAAARRLLTHERSTCTHAHEVVTSATRPVTAAERDTMRANWDAPFLADPDDEEANAERSTLTLDLADAILAAPLRARIGEMTVDTGGWSKERADVARAAGPAGSPEWFAALGHHEHATLTADGKPAVRDAWCTCPNDDVAAADWIRYEVWEAAGCTRHGFVHAGCRKLLQTG